MNLIICRKSTNEILIYLFVLFSVLVPSDIFFIKKILLFAVFFLNFNLIFSSLLNNKGSYFLFFGFIFPSYLVIYSSFLTQDIITSILRSFVAYMILILIVIRFYRIDFERILFNSIYIIIISTVFLIVLDFLSIQDVNDSFFREEIMYGFDIGLMGKSVNYPLYYKVFFKTSPLIVFVLFFSFHKSKYIIAFFSFLALIFSGTRANFIFPVFFLFFYYYLNSYDKSKLVKIFLAGVLVIILVFFSGFFISTLIDIIFTKGEVSDTIRSGHIKGIIELIKQDPWVTILGSGMGSEFYSFGVNDFVSSFEWSYIDLWRQMGILFFSIFMVFVLAPLFLSNSSGAYKKYAYLAYLCIAATNPLLFSSTSYLVFLYMYYDSFKKFI